MANHEYARPGQTAELKVRLPNNALPAALVALAEVALEYGVDITPQIIREKPELPFDFKMNQHGDILYRPSMTTILTDSETGEPANAITLEDLRGFAIDHGYTAVSAVNTFTVIRRHIGVRARRNPHYFELFVTGTPRNAPYTGKGSEVKGLRISHVEDLVGIVGEKGDTIGLGDLRHQLYADYMTELLDPDTTTPDYAVAQHANGEG